MQIALTTSHALIQKIPETVFAVCESGIHHAAEIKDMQQRGFDGFLIGGHCMDNPNPGVALRDLLQG